MSLLDKLERRLGRFAIPHLALAIVVGQSFVLLASLPLLHLLDLNYFVLVPDLVRQGEWWRLVTFIFMPPPPGMFGYVFTAFGLYLFYLMSVSLEGFWGVFRFNLFLLTGYVLSVGVAFLHPEQPTLNLFIASSVFLAFARLNPDFELAIMFIFPVKIKWLALITWALNTVGLLLGGWPLRLQILASVGNYLLFFGYDIVQTMRHRQRTMSHETKRFSTANDEPEVRHRCRICSKTNITDPQMDFRYCSKCAGDLCYCADHIFKHEHVLTDSAAAKK